MENSRQHPAFEAVFKPGNLSFGLVLPLTRAGETRPDPHAQLYFARLADRLGFSALWVRDVPLNSPDYPDPVEHLDPWVHLGALAAATDRITLITGAIVSPLRHFIHTAKGAASVDYMSKGRFLLGLGSGDRPGEFRPFGRELSDAAERFRENWERISALLNKDGRIDPSGTAADPNAEIRPRPLHGNIPMLAVGSAGQTIGWIARNACAWATYYRPLARQRDRYAIWRAAVQKVDPTKSPAFASSLRLQLEDNTHAPTRQLGLGLRLGRNGLIEELLTLREMGAEHIMFNLTSNERPAEAVIQELASEVIPQFR
ncbi:TIGR03571 family LLM class oxidoreductase [Rhizobium calliandrae]|uniref:TIGR03571 family LLM class oxidoreductase n=1 Tax=Rhizobium calliandrae TaxID=1312182 RepID=A0ABT7KK19_9HYPH|nr:TIGR03571 family LLM class oxidoreductase [Rhizobium calliandrae]MDL2408984.1 TIGR03571 family LLM class oxidoreductase [Rhizobium calliandrae]